MDIERKIDLSVYYWLVDLFSDASFVNIEDGFPTSDLTIPTVSVDWDMIDTENYELGNRTRMSDRLWYIDIFAKTKSQRDEFAYRIMRALEDPIQVYNYDEGFPPSVTPSELGWLLPERVKVRVLKIFPELTSVLYWRTTVKFNTNYSNPEEE
jgi:hypothetical protein